MKKFLVSLCALFGATAGFAQQTEEPIITFHSDAFKEIGESNLFSILLGATEEGVYVDVDCGAGANEYELKLASINSSTGEFEGTWIPIRVNAEGEVKIYGDASKIDVIVAEGGYITDIDMDKCSNLEIINLQHNALRSLDLTPFSKTFAIYLSDNPFTAQTPLVVGAPKPDLQILEVDIIDHISDSFNISDYPALRAFDAYHNRGLKSLDPTGCPELMVLSVELTDIETLDVTKNPKLIRLNIAESRITEIDLSKNVALQHFLANHDSGTINTDIRLKNVDLTKNTSLVLLNLNGNGLDSINLVANTSLSSLSLRNNEFSSINLGSNNSLYSVDISYNSMDYSTLPLPKNTWGEYFYEQRALPVARAQKVGSSLDLASRVLREGTVTSAALWRDPVNGEPEPVDSAAYSFANGIITFNQVIADSCFVVYSNDVFSEYTLHTSHFLIKSEDDFGEPSRILSFSTPASNRSFSFKATVSGPDPKLILDYGDGLQAVECPAGVVDVSAPEGFTGAVSILIPEGNSLTGFEIDSVPLASIDLSAASELKKLVVTNAGLNAVDLSLLRDLRSLDLSGNNLSALDLAGVYGDYEKNQLSSIKAANNKLTSVNIVATRAAVNLDLSNNLLPAFDLTNFFNVKNLDLSNNKIAGDFSLTYQIEAQNINLSNNLISALTIDYFSNLARLDVSSNPLTFESLPLPADVNAADYVYSPMLEIQLRDKVPAVNLSAQNISGKTVFSWFKADGTPLVQGVDIDCVGGATRFLRYDLGEVYCSMTNPLFPGLTLSTTKATVVEAPTNCIASFTTPQASEGGRIIMTANSPSAAVYIDWRGDGSDYVEYSLRDSYTEFPVETFAGADVKMYTYGSAADLKVLTLGGFPMSRVDVEQLDSLTALAIETEGLTPDSIKLPVAPNLVELRLSGCGLTSYPYADRYPRLSTLSLANNKLKSFDASVVPQVSILVLSSNVLKSVKFNNPRLWDLHLDNNALESVDLNGLPALDQLFLNSNYLASVNLEPVKSTLFFLSLATNCFTFATLPVQEDFPRLMNYYYGAQDPIDVSCIEGRVDLSAQASVRGKNTVYNWYLGEAVYDSETGEYSGELLIENEEFTVNDGITSFLTTFSEQVQCVMINEVFPNLQLTTKRLFVDQAGIVEISAPARDANGTFDLMGRPVANPARPGIYIVNGHKTLVK